MNSAQYFRHQRKGERAVRKCRVCGDWLTGWLGQMTLTHPECAELTEVFEVEGRVRRRDLDEEDEDES